MTIIGIIAALTIPSLITSTSKSETEAKLQKFYANMSQAIELLQSDYDADISTFATSTTPSIDGATFVDEYLKDYIKGAKDPDHGSGSTSYFNFDDGTSMSLHRDHGYSCYFVNFYVNGYARSTEYGVDIFRFYITDDGVITRHPSDNNVLETSTLISRCEANKNVRCTELIQRNGWKIPDDYPLDI